jgi:hypothetical protein
MPRIALASADTPFGQRLIQGLGYPLRGSGLATCVALALIHYVALLPSYIGALASALVWAATWRTAMPIRPMSAVTATATAAGV